jgi:hypothetical protein
VGSQYEVQKKKCRLEIDYFFEIDNLLRSFSGAFIMPEVIGADHCPVGIILDNDSYTSTQTTTLSQVQRLPSAI